MPNWCSNNLEVTGDSVSIAEFRKAVTSTIFPKERRGEWGVEWNLCSAIPLSSGEWDYDVANREWGSKWGDCETFLDEESETRLHFTYDTAWGPMDNAIIKLSTKFPKLSFINAFWEPGMGFRGEMICEKGALEVTTDEEYYEGLVTPDDLGEDVDNGVWHDNLLDKFNQSFDPFDFSSSASELWNDMVSEVRAEREAEQRAEQNREFAS